MKTIETIKEVLEKLKDIEAVANQNLSEWPRETRPGMETRKAQAVRDLPKVTNEYAVALTSRVAKILVTGKTSLDEFVVQMKREGAFVYSAEDFYRSLAQTLEPLISYGGGFTSGAFIRLVELTQDFADDNNIGVLPLHEPVNVSVHNFEDLVKTVRNVIRNTYGDTLNKTALTYRLINDAVSKRYDKEVVLFTVVGLSDEEREHLTSGLFPNQPSFAVDLTETDTPDTIKSFTTKLYRQVFVSFRKLGKVE